MKQINDLCNNNLESRVLVVGTGGIGCELLKNLVLTGIQNIDIIDLDTIDVSNLNRQFLFQKKHIGKSKAEVAKQSALLFNPNAKITAHHASIFSSQFNTDFFSQFKIVMNALDNRAARNHVNRMCLAADVPLIESGTEGYLGQVTVIMKGKSECYECMPKATQKTYPGCTIRNTPSEPIHCIVWAKHLFSQLFGEYDSDEEVAPDAEDPELLKLKVSLSESEAITSDNTNHATVINHEDTKNDDATISNNNNNDNDLSNDDDDNINNYNDNLNNNHNNNITGEMTSSLEKIRISTRMWAESIKYDGVKLFNKLFFTDIEYLLSMSQLWEKRRPPTPTLWESAISYSHHCQDGFISNGCVNNRHSTDGKCEGLEDQKIWSIDECANAFNKCVGDLYERMTNEGNLVWDKDDIAALDFVTAAANIRSFIFAIPQKSRFDIKSMAGNIVPAIATTNAIVGGLIVIEALKIFRGEFNKCRSTYLLRKPSAFQKTFSTLKLPLPAPNCYVCSPKPQAIIRTNPDVFTLQNLQDRVLKERFSMIAPDVEIDDGRGTIIISSEEGETEENLPRTLSSYKISHSTRLKCDDFMQNYNLVVTVHSAEEMNNDPSWFEVEGDAPQPKVQPGVEDSIAKNNSRKRKFSDSENESKRKKIDIVDNDIIIL